MFFGFWVLGIWDLGLVGGCWRCEVVRITLTWYGWMWWELVRLVSLVLHDVVSLLGRRWLGTRWAGVTWELVPGDLRAMIFGSVLGV